MMKYANKRAFDGCLATPEDIQEGLSEPTGVARPSRVPYRQAAHILRAVANEDRFRILCRLHDSTTTVTALADELELPQPAVSQHLAKLREAKLVDFVQDQKRRVYSLSDRGTATLIEALRRTFRV